MDEKRTLLAQTDSSISSQFLEFVKKTDGQAPDPAAVHALQIMLEQHPELWRVAGDLAHTAAMSIVNKMRAYPLVAESLKRGWAVMKDELGYQLAPPLERLLVEQVVLCWLHLNIVEIEYTGLIGQSPSPADADHWERRLSAAQGRYLRACETLARIRKLARNTPALQVNIAADGGQQLNVAGAVLPVVDVNPAD
jgi:hypothetical protein